MGSNNVICGLQDNVRRVLTETHAHCSLLMAPFSKRSFSVAPCQLTQASLYLPYREEEKSIKTQESQTFPLCQLTWEGAWRNSLTNRSLLALVSLSNSKRTCSSPKQVRYEFITDLFPPTVYSTICTIVRIHILVFLTKYVHSYLFVFQLLEHQYYAYTTYLNLDQFRTRRRGRNSLMNSTKGKTEKITIFLENKFFFFKETISRD